MSGRVRDALTGVCLKGFWTVTELSTKRFVILFIGDPSQEVQAVQVVKDFHADSVPFLSGSWMVDLEGSFWHIQLGEVGL